VSPPAHEGKQVPAPPLHVTAFASFTKKKNEEVETKKRSAKSDKVPLKNLRERNIFFIILFIEKYENRKIGRLTTSAFVFFYFSIFLFYYILFTSSETADYPQFSH
jgi:hypothetical protein